MAHSRRLSITASFALLLLAACGSTAKTDPRYPPRPEGCDVKVYNTRAVDVPFDNIGHADAICGSDIGVDSCMAELKNQACKLGGDLVYDVPRDPLTPTPDKIQFTGRVAHTRAAGMAPPPPPPK
jgi:hypothetical protein